MKHYPLAFFTAFAVGLSTTAIAVRNALGLPPHNEQEQAFFDAFTEQMRADNG